MAPETHKGALGSREVAKLDACQSPVPKNLSSKIAQGDDCSPTEQQVEAYIHALESELSHGRDRWPGCAESEHAGTTTTKARPTDSFSLFWGVVAATVGCFWWLAKIMSKTLN